ncbi:MAG: methyltransferase domain-containing protein [Proteobacteria bacterium]|nr:methyltransferase domain-containing protein [Pseudomonadota bacterium]
MTDWDKRYRDGFYDGAKEPHELLKGFWQAIPRGRVIDIAMGNGRDAAFLAGKGFDVYGIEKSTEAIKIAGQAASNVSIIYGDAGLLPFKNNSAEGVLVFYFLLRSIMGDIINILKKGGVLVYETFLGRQNDIDRRRNPDFLLDDGELISYFRKFENLFYEETITTSEGKRRAIARFVGRKR